MAGRGSDASQVLRVIIYVARTSLTGAVAGTTGQSTESCLMLREWLPQQVLHWWVEFLKQMQPLLCLLSQGPDPETAAAKRRLSINWNTLGMESEPQTH